MQKTLHHNVEVLQNQTISRESFKNMDIVITSNYKLTIYSFKLLVYRFIYLLIDFLVLSYIQQYFSYIMVTSFSGGGSRVPGENHRPWASIW
jgi:hypothetical protein